MHYVNSGLKVPLLDAVDKFTIAELKYERVHSDKDRSSVENEHAFYKKVLDGYRKDGIQVKDEWIATMKEVNARLWDVEEDIRSAKKNNLPFEEVGKLAVKLRDLNNERVQKRDAQAREIGIDLFETGATIAEDTSLKFPLFEAVDRFTITSLKLERLTGDKNYATFEKELGFYKKVIEAYRKEGVGITDELIAGMKDINGRVWDLEGAIRQGREEEFGLEEMGRRTIELRELAKERYGWKNKIAAAVGSDFYEAKTEII